MIPIKYQCNIGQNFSQKDQQNLLTKTICVFGAGGVGSWVLEFLARLGVKKIICFDNDIYEEEDIGQKNFVNYENLGEKKVNVVLKELQKISPNIIYEFYSFDYEEKYSDKILEADIILNAADMKLETILSLLETFKDKSIYYITGFLSTTNTFIINFDLSKTNKDYFIKYHTRMTELLEIYSIKQHSEECPGFHGASYRAALLGSFFISNMIRILFSDTKNLAAMENYNYIEDSVTVFPSYSNDFLKQLN